MRELQAWAAIATPVLIATGGFFAWWRFIRQGEHDARLQPVVSETAVVHESVAYMIATVTVQNTGLVDVELSLESCAPEILTTSSTRTGWKDQAWIELPREDALAVGLDLTVAGDNEVTRQTVEIVSLLHDKGGN